MNEDRWPTVWRKLTTNQRIYVMNHSGARGEREVPQSAVIVAGRALRRLGLADHEVTALGVWARAEGYAVRDGPEVSTGGWPPQTVPTWSFTAPPPATRKIDPYLLAAFAADGHYAAAIAQRIGVTREAVRAAAKRQGLTLANGREGPRPARMPGATTPTGAPDDQAMNAKRPCNCTYDLMTPEQLGAEWQIEPKTLANWRSRRVGPPYVKINPRVVRYSRVAVSEWLAAQQDDRESE